MLFNVKEENILRKYISAFLVLTLALTALLIGLPGAAKADGVTFTVTPDKTEMASGGEVTFTFSITNGTSAELADCSIYYGGSKVSDDFGNIPAGNPANGNFKMTVSTEMLDQTLTFSLMSSGSQQATAATKISKKALTVKLDVSVKADKTIADTGDTVTFTFKLENNGDSDITGVVVKDTTSGKTLKDKFDLGKGKDYSFTYKATMTTGDITVTPKISYKANGADQTPITKDPITVKLSVRDVKMSVSVDNPSPQAGEEVTFTLNLTNDGNMSYSKLKVSLAGEEVDFPASKLKPGDTFTQTYKRSYETSTEVIFSVTMVDQNGEQRPLDKTVTITLPVDASAVSDKLKLIMNVDRPQLTSAGTINFTGYISNATDYDFINLQVTETSLGDVFSTSALAASGQENIKYTADINATTTYNFVLTATDQDGTEYTIKADPITVTVQSVTPTPTNFEEAANVTESADAETSGSFNASKFFLILAIVLVVLILGVGAALFVLWKKGKTSGGRPSGGRPSGSRPSGNRPSPSGRPVPRPSSPSAPRKSPSAGSGSYGRGPAPRKPSGPTKSYRDRNNF
jgi:uncharacterized repeat protein (TIGR01451 family)